MHLGILNVENKREKIIKTIISADYVTAEDWRDFPRRKFIP